MQFRRLVPDSSTGARQQVIDFRPIRDRPGGEDCKFAPCMGLPGRVSADRCSLAVTPEIVEAPPAATAVIGRFGRSVGLHAGGWCGAGAWDNENPEPELRFGLRQFGWCGMLP